MQLCLNFSATASRYVFKESVDVNSDMTIEFDQSEAKYPVEFHYFDENNGELFMDIYDGGRLDTPGNINCMDKLTSFVHKDYGSVGLILSSGYMQKDCPMEFYINNVSDKYYTATGTNIGKGSECYTFKTIVSDFTQPVYNTDPANLKKCVTTFDFSAMKINEADAHFPAADFALLIDGMFIVGTPLDLEPGNEGNTVVNYIDCPEAKITDSHPFNVTVTPMFADYYEFISDEYGDYNKFYYIRGVSMLGNAGEGVTYVNAGNDYDWGGFNTPEGFDDNRFYPGHPEFTFKNGSGNFHYGNNVPLCSYRAIKYPEGGAIGGWDMFTYIGRYGEEYDSQVPVANTMYNTVEGGQQLIIINENPLVDGAHGKNVTEVVYDNNKADFTAPTFQMLSFKNNLGNLTDRFETMEGARMIFAGGDFTYHDDPITYIGHFTCEDPASVKAYYAQAGTDNWAELTVKEDKSKRFMPAFGNFYEVDLSGIKVDGVDVWFDVRLEITDAAGNYQKQTISPAFQVNSTHASIGQISAAETDNALVIKGKNIMLADGEKALITVYSVDGRALQSVFANSIDLNGVNAGIYIVTAKTANGTVFSRKIAI